jgi:hypothetical protein
MTMHQGRSPDPSLHSTPCHYQHILKWSWGVLESEYEVGKFHRPPDLGS